MPEDTAYAMEGFAGGVNMRDAPNQLAPDEARAIKNMVLDERGGARKRMGSVKLGADLSGRIISLYTFYRASGLPQVIAHLSDGTVKYTENDGTSWANIVTGVSQTEPYCFKTFNNKVYMSNGVNDYAAWTGSAYQTFPTAPKGKYLTVWKDTMWVSGVAGLRDRVYSSDPGNAESFSATAWIDIGKGDGDEVTALDTDENYLIMFKRRRIAIMYDAATFANRWSDTDKGCESHFSVVHHGERIFFLSRLGVCEFLSDAPSREVSQRISPLFDPLLLNLNQLHRVWAYTYGSRVGWAFIEAGEADHSLLVELSPYLEKLPFTFHRLKARCFTSLRVGGTEKMFFGKSTQPKLMQIGVGGTDEGEIFEGVVEPGWFDMGDPLRVKYLRQMWVVGRGRFFVSVFRNFEFAVRRSAIIDIPSGEDRWGPDGIDTWGGPGFPTQTWGPAAGYGVRSFHPDVYGRYLSLRFSDSEDEVGSRFTDVADEDHPLPSGEWAIYGGSIHGILMGVNLQ